MHSTNDTKTKTRASFLVTNDDGVLSPLLPPFLRALRKISGVENFMEIFPREEQSWIGHSITRFRPIKVTQTLLNKHQVYTASGTPADCVNLGLFNLSQTPASAVISGINMGTNAGIPFFYSSGTVGGAIQGALCGVPSIAVSVQLPAEVYTSWTHHKWDELESHKPDFERIAVEAVRLIQHVTDVYANASNSTAPSFVSINLPWNVNIDTSLVSTKLRFGHFGRLFADAGNGWYRHTQPELRYSEDVPTGTLPNDREVVRNGSVSITPIWLDGHPPEPDYSDFIKTLSSPKTHKSE